MAQFFNQATLSYNGTSTTSNVTVGELLEVLSATKRAVSDNYSARDTVTYAISIVNAGLVPFTNLTVTDDLGAYTDGTLTLVPLSYVPGSVQLYTNGILQPAPAVTAEGDSLVFSGITVPASGNSLLLYEVTVNDFAPQSAGSSITNSAVISGGGLSAPITVTSTITAEEAALLTISKSICPATVAENGQITYTFVIQNAGNTEAVATDSVSVSDLFDPILEGISVTFNGSAWTAPTNYTYDESTGQFTTVPGEITVPAATYTRDEESGRLIVNPGVSILTVTGTV